MSTLGAAKREDDDGDYQRFEVDIVGTPNPVIDRGVIEMPLVYEDLKVLSPEDRATQVVRRANYYCHIRPLVETRNLREACEAAVIKAFDKFPPESQLLPLEKMSQVFRYDKSMNQMLKAVYNQRKKANPGPDEVVAAFTRRLEIFRTTLFCKSLMKLMEPLITTKKIDNIVAFGGMSFCGLLPEVTHGCQIQHAAMVIIREMIKAKSGQTVPIYLQDPQYIDRDVEVAKLLDMEIMKCDIGHQMGWLAITDSSLVVDLCSNGLPLSELLSEISRPVAILFQFSINLIREQCKNDPNSELAKAMKKRPFCWFSEPLQLYVRDLPGVNPTECDNLIDNLYDPTPLDMTGFEMGSRGDSEAYNDGQFGYSHLGIEPTLYTRRS